MDARTAFDLFLSHCKHNSEFTYALHIMKGDSENRIRLVLLKMVFERVMLFTRIHT